MLPAAPEPIPPESERPGRLRYVEPVPSSSARAPRRTRLVLVGLSLLAAGSGLLSACGGDDGASGAPEPTTAAGKRGQALAKDNGCVACHSPSGQRMTGPTWKGLAGSERDLADGTTVIADDAYLTRAMNDPKAQVVEGFPPIMPENDLEPAEVKALIAYIHELSER